MHEISRAALAVRQWVDTSLLTLSNLRAEYLVRGILIVLILFVLAYVSIREYRKRKRNGALELPQDFKVAEAENATSVEEVAEEPACPDEIKLQIPETYGETISVVAEETGERFFERLRNRLSKTHDTLIGRVDRLISRRPALDADVYDDLEEILVSADMGVRTSFELLSVLQQDMDGKQFSSFDSLKGLLKERIYGILNVRSSPFDPTVVKPFVIMVVGVNGVGKTTTIGKLAASLGGKSRKVMLVAADTFRAAAIEQLEFWSKKTGTDFISQNQGSDPSAVAYDAVHAALSRGTDIMIVDTAGRLHTKANLMEELKKVKRILGRELPGSPHEILLVLDATTGQNAIIQARAFHEALGVTGFILTKLDGTAKGGVIIGIANELRVPIRYIGIGEATEDLAEFDPKVFLDALFS